MSALTITEKIYLYHHLASDNPAFTAPHEYAFTLLSLFFSRNFLAYLLHGKYSNHFTKLINIHAYHLPVGQRHNNRQATAETAKLQFFSILVKLKMCYVRLSTFCVDVQ